MTEVHPSLGLSYTRAVQPEQAVFEAWQQYHDPAAAELILGTYRRFLSSEVRSYRHHPDVINDLEQEGRWSLLNHARTYHPATATGDASFFSYFKPGVHGDIFYCYLNTQGAVHISSSALARYAPIIGEQRRREIADRARLTEDEIARLFNVPARGPAIVKYKNALTTATGILFTMGIWGAERQGELLPDEWESAQIVTDRNDYLASTEEIALDNVEFTEFTDMLALLDRAFEPKPNSAPPEVRELERQKMVLMQRLGLTDGTVRSYAEIAEYHRISDSRVGQLYAVALTRLQTFAFKQGIRPTPADKPKKAGAAPPEAPSSPRPVPPQTTQSYPKKW
ncbi:MAG TPA: hypothetical protein VLI54_04870 [Bacillota bacterium]|nr:hypothetical protein [Bacillota bacterium]